MWSASGRSQIGGLENRRLHAAFLPNGDEVPMGAVEAEGRARVCVWMRMCGCGRERCVCVCMCYRVHDISLFLTPPFVFGVFSPPPLLLFSPLPPLCPFTSLLRARATDARWCRRSFLFESKRKPRRPSWPGRWRRHPAAARGMQRVSHNARMRVCVCACVRVCVCACVRV